MSFVEARVGLLHRDAETRKLVVTVAFSDAEIEPAAGEEIECRRLFGQQHRVVPGQHDNRGAEPQPSGACAEPGQQAEGGRDLAIAGEVVLDDKGAVKAERLGLDVVFDEIAKPLAAVELGTAAPRRGAAEQTELHRSRYLPPMNPGPRLCRSARCSKCRLLIIGIAHRHDGEPSPASRRGSRGVTHGSKSPSQKVLCTVSPSASVTTRRQCPRAGAQTQWRTRPSAGATPDRGRKRAAHTERINVAASWLARDKKHIAFARRAVVEGARGQPYTVIDARSPHNKGLTIGNTTMACLSP
jgi:hypothetical protein